MRLFCQKNEMISYKKYDISHILILITCKSHYPHYTIRYTNISHMTPTQDTNLQEEDITEEATEIKPTLPAQKASRFGSAGFQGGSKFGK